MADEPAQGGDGSGLVAQVEAALLTLDERPLGEHVEVFDGVHRALQDALASLDGV